MVRQNVHLLGSLLLLTVAVAAACFTPSDVEPRIAPHDAWRHAAQDFRDVGNLIGQSHIDEARRSLHRLSQQAPAPYRATAARYAERLEAALPDTRRDRRAYRAGELGLLCYAMGAEQAAITWLQRVKQIDSDDSRRFARTLTEARQASVLSESASTDFRWGLESIDGRYFPQAGRPRRDLAALEELAALARRPLSLGQRAAVYRRIFECLANLEDEAGLRAWEDRFLSLPDVDDDHAVEVLTARAQRLITKHRPREALQELRSLRYRFPATTQAVDAGYHIALLYMQQSRYSEARQELQDIVEGNGHAAPTWPSTSVRIRCLFALTSCYEVEEDYQSKLVALHLLATTPEDDGWDCTNSIPKLRINLEQHALLQTRQYRDAVQITLDALKQHQLLGTSAARLVRLYAAANQIPDLIKMIDACDASATTEANHRGIPEAAIARMLPGQILRPFIEIEQLRDRGDHQALLKIACATASTARLYSRSRNLSAADYAAEALVKLDSSGGDLLIDTLEAGKGGPHLYFALAEARSAGVTLWIIGRALAATDYLAREYLYHSLVLLGPAGSRELHRLALSEDVGIALLAKRVIEDEAIYPRLRENWPSPAPGSLPVRYVPSKPAS